MNQLFINIIEITLVFSLVIVVMFLAMHLIGKKFTAKCRYILWAVIFIRLAIPFGSFSDVALFTLKVPVNESSIAHNTVFSSSNISNANVVENFDNNDIDSIDNSDMANGIKLANNSSTSTIANSSPSKSFIEIYGALILSIMALIWATVGIVYFLWHITIYLLYTAKVRRNLLPASQSTYDILTQLCKEKKITRIPRLSISRTIESPILFGFFKSTIVIPENIEGSNSLTGIISHELLHYRRCDLWLKLIAVFAESMHWFNPLVHIAARRFETEMELSCDELVLKNYDPEARASYGNAMLEIVKRCNSKNTALTTHFNPKKSSIKERFMNILDNTKKRSGRTIIILMVLVCVLAGTLIACGTSKSTVTSTEGNTNSEPETKESETEEAGLFTPTGTAKVINLYQYSSDRIISDSQKRKSSFDSSSLKFLGSYPATNADAYTLCSHGSKILLYDGEYFIYDHISGKSKTINIPDINIVLCSFIYDLDSNKLLGLSICKDNYKYAFYSFETETFVTDFSYSRLDSISTNNFLVADLSNSEGVILDIDTGKVLLSVKVKYNFMAKFLTYKDDCYLLINDTMHGSYDIYNSDLKLILSNNVSYDDQIMLSDNGNVTVIDTDRTTYSSYNQKGERVFHSKNYKQVFGLSNNLVCVVDTDGYLKLINYTTGAEVIKFTEWSEKMSFASCIFYNEATKYNSVGLYIMTIDTSVSADTVGYMKEYYYNPSTGEYDILQFKKSDGYEKPILYLYPTEKTEITVKFTAPDLLTTTYPKYKDSWNVTANPDGSLYDVNGRYYYGLYWEEKCFKGTDFNTGFYVTADNASEFLEEKLEILEFTEREANEFIMYWLPILEKNGQNLVYFELTESREAYNSLNITPAPDSLLRVAIHVKRVDSFRNIKEQYLPTF